MGNYHASFVQFVNRIILLFFFLKLVSFLFMCVNLHEFRCTMRWELQRPETPSWKWSYRSL